jgi:hypothetical protein
MFLRSLVSRVLREFGLQLCRINDEPSSMPNWICSSEPDPIRDEVIADGWDYNVLHMSNKYYSPSALSYRRTEFGLRGYGAGENHFKYFAYFLDLRDQRVLELGPHEGHFSVLIEKMGARENIAIEGRVENYRKCLRIKEKYGLSRTAFLHAKIEDLYNDVQAAPFSGAFDLVFCVGFLYHLSEPGKALRWFAKQSPNLFLATHYVEKETPRKYQREPFFDGVYSYQGHEYNGKWYRQGLYGDRFSGLASKSFWLYETDLLELLKNCGYETVHVLGKDSVNMFPYIYVMANTLPSQQR